MNQFLTQAKRLLRGLMKFLSSQEFWRWVDRLADLLQILDFFR